MTTVAVPAGRSSGRAWVPLALVALALLPLAAGTARVVQLIGGPELLAADRRFDASPAPVVVHVVAAAAYAVVGAFQFSTGVRRRWPRWHRAAGRVLVVAGLLVAASALAMTLLFEQKEGTGALLWVFRLLAGTATAAALVLGLAAARQRRIAVHRAWMRRAYALALGAGTQPLTVGLGEAAFGSGVVRTDLMLGAGWGLNLAVAEWLNRSDARVRA